MFERLPRSASVADARAAVKSHFEDRNVRSAATQFPTVRASATAADTTEILLYDEIGFWGVTAKDFVSALSTVTTPNILLRINSPGGDVFDGIAIHSALKSFKGSVTAKIEGVAASAASFIALAASDVQIDPHSFVMIHNAWGFAIGNKIDMLDMASTLEKIDTQLASIYSAKTGKSQAEIAELMNGESDGTWFSAEEAKALGIVDTILDQDGDSDGDKPGDPDMDHDAENAKIFRIRARLRVARAG